MVLKDMHVNENLSMDNHRNPTFTTRRGFTLSFTTLILLAAFFICTLVAVSFIIYNFATCNQLTPAPDEDIICTSVNVKYLPKSNDSEAESAAIGLDGKPRTKDLLDLRLPRAIKPLKYNISIIPYLNEGNFTFEGGVKIQILVVEDCYNITMHAIELNISRKDVTVRRVITDANTDATNNDDDGLRIRKQYLLEAKQFFVIELYDKLVRDTIYEISIKFDGLLQDYLQGFYRSSYLVRNETRWMASTQFQPTDARKAFPCFDEPSLKAKFTLNIARPEGMATVSNMPIVATRRAEYPPNYIWESFAESLPMSTYLVAYAVSDFGHISTGNFSVWARKDAIESARYALQIGPSILKYLEEYFAIPFPLPKMDMIAIPDFQAGAMENWGLITYRESTMLLDEGISATTNKQRIASVIGHELAHQWFGNLVTPSWWNDLWLNEGFASYMEYVTVDAIAPKWKTMDQFVVNELQNVFQLDALSSSHQISTEVFNPDEISELFDRISYAKGATIIRMMSHFLTSKIFRRGLSKYLKEMSYNSADQNDLWRFLTDEATAFGLLDNSTTVKEIMDTWTLQVGYPVVKVSRDPVLNVIRMEQERFVFVKENNTANDFLWWIPITFTTAEQLDFESTRPVTWIPRSKVYEIENRSLIDADWFIFNIQQTGYYRTNYDVENWNAIIRHLMKPQYYKEIAPANRAQLIDDVMNFARAGYLHYGIALNLTRYLAHEVDHVPWKAAITAFNLIDSMFVNQGDYHLLKNYLLKLLDFVYNKIGFDDSGDEEDMLKIFKRMEILNMACHLGHHNCIAESIRHFQNWMQVPNPDANNPISPNLRGIVYCTAIQYGTESEWNFAFERYLQTTVSSEKEILLSALGCSKEPWILFRYLRRAIAGDSIRKQDVSRVFISVSNNVVGQQITFDFIRTNWREIKKYLGSAMTNLNTILLFVTKRMNTKFLFDELETFVKNDLHENSLPIKQALEQVQVNVNWMNNNYKPIVEWLQQESVK